jgi:hypothetical protein
MTKKEINFLKEKYSNYRGTKAADLILKLVREYERVVDENKELILGEGNEPNKK